MKKKQINTNFSIGTVLQRLQCINEQNINLQEEIEELIERRESCCNNAIFLDGEVITLGGEPVTLS